VGRRLKMLESSVPVAGILKLPAWTLVYSEIAPEAYTYTGAWTRRWIDFGIPEPMTMEELVAALAPDRSIVEHHGVILNLQLWRDGAEEKSQRWALGITVYPRPDVHPPDAVRDPTWFWPQVSQLLPAAAWWDVYGKFGENVVQPITEAIGAVMGIMVMGLMMLLIMPMMTAQKVAPEVIRAVAPVVREVAPEVGKAVREVAPEAAKAAIPAAIAAIK
jgi:hypothetical protein